MREEMLFHQELWEEGEILTYQEALFIIKETETYIQKKKNLETGNSLHRGPVGDPGGRFIYQGLWETVKRVLDQQSISLSMGALWGELRGRAPLLGTLKARSHQYPETGLKTDFGPWSDCKGQTTVL